MALTEVQQLKQLIDQSHYIMVIFSGASDVDSISSSLAIFEYLHKNDKQVDIISPNFAKMKNLRFLDNLDKIKANIANSQKFTIKVDVSNTKIDTLSYDIKNDWLSIYLNPKEGTISKKDLRTAQSSFKYDLIITINSSDLESLGTVFENNTDLFYRLPIINIDHNPANEHYGQVNLIDVGATSTTEIIFDLITQLDESLIKDNLATSILCGLISKTRSFKSGNITPRTLSIASKLMKAGADRQTIIKHLFYHRSIASLKLWGKALSHMQSDSKRGLVWTTITRDDFMRSGADEVDLEEIVDELLVNSPEAEVIVLLYEKKDNSGIHGQIITNTVNALQLASKFNGQGSKRKAHLQIGGHDLTKAEEDVIKEVKKILT